MSVPHLNLLASFIIGFLFFRMLTLKTCLLKHDFVSSKDSMTCKKCGAMLRKVRR